MCKFLKNPYTQLSAQKAQKWESHPKHDRYSHLKKINRKPQKSIRGAKHELAIEAETAYLPDQDNTMLTIKREMNLAI